MPKKAPKPVEHLEFVPVLIDKIELKQVRIIEIQGKITIAGGMKPMLIDTAIQVNVGNGVDGTIIGNVTIKLSHGDPEQPEDKHKTSLGIFLHCQCVFAITSPLDNPELGESEAALLNSTVTQIAWPYLRAQINNMTGIMGIAPITLPLMRGQTFSKVAEQPVIPAKPVKRKKK